MTRSQLLQVTFTPSTATGTRGAMDGFSKIRNVAVDILTLVIAFGAGYWFASTRKSNGPGEPKVADEINFDSSGPSEVDEKVKNGPNARKKDDKSPEYFKIPFSGPNLVALRVRETSIDCSSRREAFLSARSMSGGLRPILHGPHRPGKKPHFHLHRHWYFVSDGKLYNYHFTYPE